MTSLGERIFLSFPNFKYGTAGYQPKNIFLILFKGQSHEKVYEIVTWDGSFNFFKSPF
jgi:hypothetical protein